jgi:hypothetical protein
MNRAAMKFSNQLLSGNTPTLNKDEMNNPREQKKISNAINNSVIHAIDMAIEQKRRCIQCTGAHDMLARVTDLAKRCIVAMLEAEKKATDPGYKSGLKQNMNARINKQNKANVSYTTQEKGKGKKENNNNYY